MIHDSVKITGRLQLRVYSEDGSLRSEHDHKNLIVTTGKALIASRLYANTTGGLNNGVVTKMAIGTNDSAPVLSDTELKQFLVDTPLFNSEMYISGDTSAVIYTATFAPGVGTSATIKEAGLFNDSGVMLCRTAFPAITKSAQETLSIVWTVTIS